MKDFVKTEVSLSEETVEKIIASKIVDVMGGHEQFIQGFVEQLANYRKPKKYSYDPDNPTFLETVLQELMEPLVRQHIEKQFNKKYKAKFEKMLSKKLAEIFSSEDSEVWGVFTKGVSEAFSKFHYYVRS